MLDFISTEIYDMPSPIVCEYVIDAENQADNTWYIPLRHIANKHLKTMSKKELDRDWRLTEFFESIFVINLPSAEKRLQKIREELKSIGTKSYEVFSAIDGRKDLDPSIWKKLHGNLHSIDISTEEGKLAIDLLHQGQAGCYMSHYSVIRKVKELFEFAQMEFELAKANHDSEAIQKAIADMRKYSRVLILEDDSGFGILDYKQKTISKHDAGCLLRKAMRELPDDWDMLYFVVQPTEPTIKISSHLYKLNYSWNLNAYAINYSMYGPLVEQLKKIEDPTVTEILPVDVEIGLIHHLYDVYAVYPSIVFSQIGQSHITDKEWSLWQGQPVFPKKRN